MEQNNDTNYKINKNKIGHSSRSSSIQRSKTTEEVSGNVKQKFSFPSIEKRWTKDKETEKKEQRKKEKKKKNKREEDRRKKSKRKKKIREEDRRKKSKK